MKTVLVTGGSDGIGRQIAIDFAKKGFRVAAVYHSGVEKANELKKKYDNIAIYQCDISSYSQVENLYKKVAEDFKNIDIVINNAGISNYGLLQDMTENDIINNISTNLNGVIFSCKFAVKHMIKNHKGAIINISSIWGINGASCETVYSAAKGGIISFTKALAKEVAPSGVTVNCVSPGVIKTKMLDYFTQQELEDLSQQTPIGRIGDVCDISNAVIFLADEQSNFITGHNLVVDGAFSIQ